MKCVFKEQEDGYFVCEFCDHRTKVKGLKKNCPKSPPTMIQRGANFAKAAGKHVASGMQHCTPEQRKERFAQCAKNECGLFLKKSEDMGICAHEDCGCPIRSHGRFMDKLSWADSECPEGYWGPILQKPEETPENGV